MIIFLINQELHTRKFARVFAATNSPLNMPIRYAARFLTNFNVSYAMVIESNEVTGMVSLNGIVDRWED